MEIKIKTSLLFMALSLVILIVARIWQLLPATISSFADLLGNVKLNMPALNISAYNCDHEYTIEILSIEPLVVYVNNFLKESEVQYLLDMSKDVFEASHVYNEKLESYVDKRYRTSTSAMIPQDDVISMCLSKRLKSMLGNVQHIETEPLQVVRYEPEQRFRTHMDWFSEPRNKTYNPNMPYRPYNRLASVFAYLEDNCTGGETYFPEIQGVSAVADGEKFSILRDGGYGLLVRPRRGNAVFWNNLLPNGTGDPRLAHAALPVETGTKIGINLFSHYYLDAPMLGGSEE